VDDPHGCRVRFPPNAPTAPGTIDPAQGKVEISIAIPPLARAPICPCEVDRIVKVVEIVAPKVIDVSLLPANVTKHLGVVKKRELTPNHGTSSFNSLLEHA